MGLVKIASNIGVILILGGLNGQILLDMSTVCYLSKNGQKIY